MLKATLSWKSEGTDQSPMTESVTQCGTALRDSSTEEEQEMSSKLEHQEKKNTILKMGYRAKHRDFKS